jgi:hypothetical protein
MEKVLLQKEEIDSLLTIQNEQASLLNEFGQLEIQLQTLTLQKETLIKTLKDLQIKSQKLGKELQQKYGEGTINIESGEFIKS